MSDVEDTHNRLAFLDGGAVLNVPLFYLEGKFLGLDCIFSIKSIYGGKRNMNINCMKHVILFVQL